ncbi:hypothetical protein F3J44_23610 [Pantoea sp. Tr-811]|uniref:hypothetical protein n=1 Tax=Pantoea sp. Tr-811 TaxID=2608361 RepID=UPI001420CF9E|nr:hypothetical protein [Pantoea sp. Tr-811]NIF29340.1 hypothetical protein [Pantoea sp. Tr-811]
MKKIVLTRKQVFGYCAVSVCVQLAILSIWVATVAEAQIEALELAVLLIAGSMLASLATLIFLVRRESFTGCIIEEIPASRLASNAIMSICAESRTLVSAATLMHHQEFIYAWHDQLEPSSLAALKSFDALSHCSFKSSQQLNKAHSVRYHYERLLAAGRAYAAVSRHLAKPRFAKLVESDELENVLSCVRDHWRTKLQARYANVSSAISNYHGTSLVQLKTKEAGKDVNVAEV